MNVPQFYTEGNLEERTAQAEEKTKKKAISRFVKYWRKPYKNILNN